MITVVRTGMGGWTYEPWRGGFYPKGVRQADELAYASRQVTAIEINGTYHSLQKRASFAKWAAATPDDFVFSLKASRFCTNRKILAEAGPAIAKFFEQGLEALGDKLGPILWQFMPTKKFERDDFAAFLDLLPRALDGCPLRHVVEVRHLSFVDPAFVDLCRQKNIAICLADHATYPMIADVTADFVYARLMTGEDRHPGAYGQKDLRLWAGRLALLASGGAPPDLSVITEPAAAKPRDVFAFIISGGKVHAPIGAIALAKAVRSAVSAISNA